MATGNPGRAKTPGNVHGAGELVALHPDHAHQTAVVVGLESTFDTLQRNLGVGLVVSLDADVDIFAEHASPGGVPSQPVDARQ